MMLVNLWKAPQLGSPSKLSKMLFKWPTVKSSEKVLCATIKPISVKFLPRHSTFCPQLFQFFSTAKTDLLRTKKKAQQSMPRFAEII